MNLKKKKMNDFVHDHPNMQIAQACLDNVSPQSISEQPSDLVSRLHIQTILMGNFEWRRSMGL